MRTRTLIPFLLALFPTACTPGSAPLTANEEAALKLEVSETLAGLTAAMNAHDPEQVFSFYRQDDSFFYLGCTDVLPGWGTFASRVGDYYRFSTDVTFEQNLLSIQLLSRTVAVAAMRGSSSEAENLFWTEVLQKDESGRWLITYEHESWPGCPVPRGPHMGTEGMGEMVPPTGGEDPGIEG